MECREKDEIIKSLRSRLGIAQQQAQRFGGVAAPPAAAVEGQRGGGPSLLEAQNAQLEVGTVRLVGWHSSFLKPRGLWKGYCQMYMCCEVEGAV